MQAAFLGFGIFPPPASGAHVFSDGNRARAGRAADARVELVVEGVVRNLVEADVGPDFLFGPVGQRVELDEAVAFVELALRQVGAAPAA